ncbi:hypothetical protein Bbelb_016000 [Branchiostoma belcheri]|nr:hypothetical protein Bbelb_016000 [Branchiostoma belcheri]
MAGAHGRPREKRSGEFCVGRRPMSTFGRLTNGKTSKQLRPLAECIRIAPTTLAHACAVLCTRAAYLNNTKCAEHFFNSARPIDPWRETIKRAENWAEYLGVEYSLYRGKKDFLLGAVLSAATALSSSAVGVGSSNTPPTGRALAEQSGPVGVHLAGIFTSAPALPPVNIVQSQDYLQMCVTDNAAPAQKGAQLLGSLAIREAVDGGSSVA